MKNHKLTDLRSGLFLSCPLVPDFHVNETRDEQQDTRKKTCLPACMEMCLSVYGPQQKHQQ
jgi:hypothetical protein